MKKVLFVCVAFAASFLMVNQAEAQQLKIGYFDEQQLLGAMPGIQKIDTLLNSYRMDSLRGEYDYTLSDYQHRDSLFKRDSATMSPKAREMAMNDINKLKYKLLRWQDYQAELEENKKQELLAPFMQKIVTALNEVVAEQKYTYVLRQDALSPYVNAPLLDNVTVRVAMKLKLQLPKELEDEWKRQSGGGAAKPATSAPAGTKPRG
ncbi:OmpH family outer membrane protein [Sediminibacterium ginsengisoli]|uniref:Outer membrane protein (OmpH-like) n=1 Tax=Sediminibacterium ginsengisoli TaxID=413434 RepID=A0A1T4M4E4_9BACT|nr:OmpH family outer membrane protein [Sediminibacterium ginsengisoli]SJZ61792.1 Outer membrane protein (OmpH-like) [Sediminibacterium ginsengisoli]